MITDVNSMAGAASSYLSLVSQIRNLGIEIPDAVTAEVDLVKQTSQSLKAAKSEYENALFSLGSVPPKDFGKAKAEAETALFKVFADTNGFGQQLVNTTARRLESQVMGAIDLWEVDVVARFNQVVADYNLNALAGNLPDLSNPKSVRILDINPSQAQAVQAWTTAAKQLHPLWNLYRKFATITGYEVGPATADNLR